MIGNDIVDLKQAAIDSPYSFIEGKRYQRFLYKVFTESEQELILFAKDKYQMVWLLWSIKEAAYKVNVQQFGKRFFNPKRIQCELISLEKGYVKIDNETYFTTSKITKDYVYSLATLTNITSIKSKCFKIKNPSYLKQSETLKKRLLESLNINCAMVKKNGIGVPKLFINEKQLNYSLSLTHHGNYNGYAIL